MYSKCQVTSDIDSTSVPVIFVVVRASKIDSGQTKSGIKSVEKAVPKKVQSRSYCSTNSRYRLDAVAMELV